MPKKGKCFLNVRLKDTLFNEKFNRRIYINNKIVMRSFEAWIINWFKVNAERKSKVDDNTAKMQSIKWLGV